MGDSVCEAKKNNRYIALPEALSVDVNEFANHT
jgi:hypothetical protein